MSGPAHRTLTVHCAPVSRLSPSPPGTIAPPGTDAVHLWYATLESLRPRHAELNELLDPVEQERAQRFRFNADRERFILGHGLLRSLLGKYLKRDGSLVRMSRGTFGKPYLERKDLRFSFSDTKDAMVVAFANKQEIGADIETMHRAVDHDAVSEHYFTAPEIKAIRDAGASGSGSPRSTHLLPTATANSSSDKEASKRRFLEFWTRKEAVLKASGVGIMDDLRSLRVDGERNTMVIAHEAFISMAAEEYHVHTWHVGPDHLISLASPVKVKEMKVWGAESA
jgi:4'-phosphopantetheinyl transferase